MPKKTKLKSLSRTRVKIFKIRNRRGYAALCLNNLTEGYSPYLAYYRLQKAVRRLGFQLPEIDGHGAQRLVRKTV